jgi:hypothetical protein
MRLPGDNKLEIERDDSGRFAAYTEYTSARHIHNFELFE